MKLLLLHLRRRKESKSSAALGTELWKDPLVRHLWLFSRDCGPRIHTHTHTHTHVHTHTCTHMHTHTPQSWNYRPYSRVGRNKSPELMIRKNAVVCLSLLSSQGQLWTGQARDAQGDILCSYKRFGFVAVLSTR